MEQFKVGDIVKPNKKADILYSITNRSHMREGVVTKVSKSGGLSVKITKWVGYPERTTEYWAHDPDCFDLVRRGGVQTELHITGDGKTVHAVLKENGKVVKRAKASCDPRDEYNFETGARLATDRVFGKETEKKERQPLFKKGDEVKVVDPEYAITTHTHPEDFSLSYGEIVRYAYGKRPQTNVPYKVLKVGKQICSGMYIYVISAGQLTPVFIVTEEGLRKVS